MSIRNGLLLGIALWVIIVAGILIRPNTGAEIVAFTIVSVLALMTGCGFLVEDGRRDPPNPDRYFTAFAPLSDDVQHRWEDDH